MEKSKESWYIVKQASEYCQVISKQAFEASKAPETQSLAQWGPFESKGEAIAKRVGLIRAGKCQPS